MNHCPVTADLNRHLNQLEREDAIAEEADRRLDALVEELTAPGAEYDPLIGQNLFEAMGEADDSFNDTLGKLIRSGNAEGVLLALKDLTTKYWADHVRSIKEASVYDEVERDYADAQAERRAARRGMYFDY